MLQLDNKILQANLPCHLSTWNYLMRREGLAERIKRAMPTTYDAMLRAVQSADPVMKEVVNNLLHTGAPFDVLEPAPGQGHAVRGPRKSRHVLLDAPSIVLWSFIRPQRGDCNRAWCLVHSGSQGFCRFPANDDTCRVVFCLILMALRVSPYKQNSMLLGLQRSSALPNSACFVMAW